jgi:hypothetical protein
VSRGTTAPLNVTVTTSGTGGAVPSGTTQLFAVSVGWNHVEMVASVSNLITPGSA